MLRKGPPLCQGISIVFQDDPHGVNDPGNVTKEGQQQIEPKVQPETDLQEDTQRRDEDCEQNADDIGVARTHAKTPLRTTAKRASEVKYIARTPHLQNLLPLRWGHPF